MSECGREPEVASLSGEALATAEWVDHIASCQACRGELLLRSDLRADGDALALAARLPSPQQALWRAKLRRGRSERRRVAAVVSFIEAAAAGILTLVLLGVVWTDLRASSVQDHRVTVIVCGLVTALALGILALVPSPGRAVRPVNRRRYEGRA